MSCQHLKIIGTCEVCKRDEEFTALQQEVKELKRAIGILWYRMPKIWVDSIILPQGKFPGSVGMMQQPEKSDDTEWLQSFLNQDT